MSSVTAERVKESIRDSWRDSRVACWVIGQLGLLHIQSDASPSPIFSLSVDGDLDQRASGSLNVATLKRREKLVLSGGLEGTEGHVGAVRYLDEVRALTAPLGVTSSLVTLLLEPDSYIEEKGRPPLTSQEQRAELWASTGLVNAVVNLPSRQTSVDSDEHYLAIHQCISPARWLTTGGHPEIQQVIFRGDEEMFDLIRVIPRKITPHASFIALTQGLTAREARFALHEHIIELAKEKFAVVEKTVPSLMPGIIQNAFEAAVKGLRE